MGYACSETSISFHIYPIGSMYGIYANIGDILMGSMLLYIAAPWILWVQSLSHPENVAWRIPLSPVSLQASFLPATKFPTHGWFRGILLGGHYTMCTPLFHLFIGVVPQTKREPPLKNELQSLFPFKRPHVSVNIPLLGKPSSR